MDCIFCKIVNKKADAEILYEDDKVMAFLDIKPLNFGHTLVIPKKHFDDIFSIEEKAFNEVLRIAGIISKAIAKGLKLEGMNLISNNGRIAGQSVFHFHVHLIPRSISDGHRVKFKTKDYTKESKQQIVELIKNELKKENIYG